METPLGGAFRTFSFNISTNEDWPSYLGGFSTNTLAAPTSLSWDALISAVGGAGGGRPLRFTACFLFLPSGAFVCVAPTFGRARGAGVAVPLAGPATAAAAGAAPGAMMWVPACFLFLVTAGAPAAGAGHPDEVAEQRGMAVEAVRPGRRPAGARRGPLGRFQQAAAAER